MSISVKSKTLLVSLIGIDQRNRNVIEMIFDKKQAGICRIASTDESHITIVDLDKYGAEEEWLALHKQRADLTAIFLSIDPTRKSTTAHFLQKPALIKDLITTLDDVRTTLNQQAGETTQKFLPWSQFLSSRVSYQQEKLANFEEAFNAEGYEDICLISEHGHLIDEVKRAVVQASRDGFGIKLKIQNFGSIFIDPTEHWINTDLTIAQLENISQQVLNRKDIKKTVYSDREFSRYLGLWRASNLKPIDIDAFLWDLALWTYNGAIPSSTDLSKKIILTYWPDLPRLTEIPNAIRIASLWVSCPMTLVETIDVLDVPKEDVFNFYTAALTIGLVKQTETIEHTPDTVVKDEKLTATDKSQRDYYLRVLKHLKGHNQDG